MITFGPPPATAFDRYHVAALASVTSDGRPHVVPLWFVWDGAAFVMYSKPGALKVRNLRREPHAMLALGEPGGAARPFLIEVLAELEARGHLLESFQRKYAEPLACIGLSPDAFIARYSQAIRLVPLRWLDWGASTADASH